MRLTNAIREDMLRVLMKGKFDDRATALCEVERALAKEVYEHELGEHLEAVRALPKGWLETSSHIRVAVSGMQSTLYFGDKTLFPMPSSMRWGYANLPARSDLGKRVAQLRDDRRALEVERGELERETRAALYSFTTDKRLLEKWPEVESVLRDVTGDRATATRNLPAIKVDSLNKRLGLPRETV